MRDVLILSSYCIKLGGIPVAGAEQRIQENRLRILDVAQKFVDRFTSYEAVESMPAPLRALASYTAQHAVKKHSQNLISFVGGFILLR